MESCARAVIGKSTPKLILPDEPPGRVVFTIRCKQCGHAIEGIQDGNAADARAEAHMLVRGHDVAITFSIYDHPLRVVRPPECR